MSVSWVGTAPVKPYFDGASSSGAMNTTVPPSSSRIGDTRLSGSGTTVVNPKSARHATGGTSFVMRMSAYDNFRMHGHAKR